MIEEQYIAIFGKNIKIRYIPLPRRIREKEYIKKEKKVLSEALQIQKNCMDFAIVVCADYLK